MEQKVHHEQNDDIELSGKTRLRGGCLIALIPVALVYVIWVFVEIVQGHSAFVAEHGVTFGGAQWITGVAIPGILWGLLKGFISTIVLVIIAFIIGLIWLEWTGEGRRFS